MEFKQTLKQRANQVESLLKEYMPSEEGYQKTIMESMNYSLSAGGKRLRPILTMEACKVVGGNVEVHTFCYGNRNDTYIFTYT